MVDRPVQEVVGEMMTQLLVLHPVAVYLFGSQVTGLSRPDSDIDLAVLFPPARPKLPVEQRLTLIANLERVAGHRVDLVVVNQAPLPLQFEIIHNGKLLYEADFDTRTDAEDLIVRDYLDLQPMYERSYREILEQERG